MFRLTQFLREVAQPTPMGPRRVPTGPVVIWNLLRRCNLLCMHCYTNSADRNYAGELTTAEALAVMRDLRTFGVPALILSGGEPLLRPDLFELAAEAKRLGLYLSLSTNGTRIDDTNIERIDAIGFDYIGVSLDGIGALHDRIRGREGAFDAALAGLRRCRERDIKIGVRFTLTQQNAADLPAILELLQRERIDKLYLSHLNYAGRGGRNRRHDAHFAATRAALDLLIEEAWRSVQAGDEREFVTGNNDADGVYLWHWVRRRHPERTEHVYGKLTQWGGNATGVHVANIDNLGNVHPDSFWWEHSLGNVRERPFSQIWRDSSDPLLAGLRASPRRIGGRCGACRHFALCNGNTRVRAQRLTGDPWTEDPGCYLDDAEIGLDGDAEESAPCSAEPTPSTAAEPGTARTAPRARDARLNS